MTRTVCGERRRLYRSGDIGRWRDDGTLECLGRRDRQVKLRGHRVELPEVERALLELDGVARAAVVLHRDVDDPARSALAAYVVGDRLDAATLRAALRQRLPEYMIPGSVTVLDRLPTTSNGKVDERSLGRARAASSADADAGEPSLAKTIARAWRDVTGAQIGVDDGFFEHGGQSITAARLAHALSDAGLPVTVRDVFVHATPRSLATTLGGGSVSWNRARRKPRPRRDVLNLVCIPHAGAGPSAFWTLADGVPPWLNLVPADLPGREERILEPPPASVDAAADIVVAQIEDVLDPQAAVAVAGQSSGGLVAYETVRRLVHDGHPPRFLLVAGTPAPTAPRAVVVSTLPDEELLERLRRRTGVDHPALRHHELRSLVLPALRADLAADEAYEPPVDLQTGVPIVAVRGRDDEYVGRDALAGWADAGSDPLVLELAGGHMVLLADATTFTGIVGRVREWARTRADKALA